MNESMNLSILCKVRHEKVGTTTSPFIENQTPDDPLKGDL